MRLLVVVQLFIYLLISPIFLLMMGMSDSYRFDLSVVVIISFFVGIFFHNSFFFSQEKYCADVNQRIEIRPWCNFLIVIFSFIYIYIVIKNGLYNRRQGSEVMAFVYANLPLSELLILRFYEILFYPILIFIFYKMKSKNPTCLKINLFAMFCAFIFMGVLYSRAKLLLPLLLYFVFFHPIKNKIFLLSIKPIYIKTFCIFVLLSASWVVIERLDAFPDFYGYFMFDIVKRVDGLELISLIDVVKPIPLFGTYDFFMFSNLAAVIPFWEEAAVLKELGLTSSKSYLLRVVLNFDQMDINNTIITDLFYFGGYPFLVFGGVVYGYFVSWFDKIIKGGKWLSGRAMIAFVISFGINGIFIENDFSGLLFSILRDFFIIYIAFFFIVSYGRNNKI